MGENGEFLDEFRQEAKDALAQIDDRILAMERGDRSAVDDVFRAMHSLKGGSSFLDLVTINRLAHHLEDVLVAIREGRMGISHAVSDLLLRGGDRLREMIDSADGGAERDVEDLVAEAEALVHGNAAEAEESDEYRDGLKAGDTLMLAVEGYRPEAPPQEEPRPPTTAIAQPTPATRRVTTASVRNVPSRRQQRQTASAHPAVGGLLGFLVRSGRISAEQALEAAVHRATSAPTDLELLYSAGFDALQCLAVVDEADRLGVEPFDALHVLGVDGAVASGLRDMRNELRGSLGEALVASGAADRWTVIEWMAAWRAEGQQTPHLNGV